MGSLSGMFQRPVVAASAVAIASVSADLHDKFAPKVDSSRQSIASTSDLIAQSKSSSWVSRIGLSNFSKIPAPVPNPNFRRSTIHMSHSCVLNGFSSHHPVLLNSYRSAELAKPHKPIDFAPLSEPPNSPEVLYRWHLPQPKAVCEKSRTVVVLLGWLGAKQKHLRRYAEWYASKGFHVITFTFPMAEILSYQVGGKAEHHVDLLVDHLSEWLEEECGKNLVFHTFSNTGWLVYGAILEKFDRQDHSLMSRIKGCIVDSAPVAAPDPQVWASGFSAAFLKKNSVAAKGYTESKPAISETALLLVLEKFFDVILNLPTVHRRLSNVIGQLQHGQPTCPQLYIYSSADRVIPAGSVESFIEAQQRAGRLVRSCNFKWTPHVDHFRHDPELYKSQLSQFLDDCVVLTSSC